MAKETTVSFTSYRKSVLQTVEQRTINALMAAGYAWDGYTKDLTPVRTGNLRNRWSLQLDRKKKRIILENDADYAKSVELGSRTNRPQHMLRDGLMHNKAEIKRLMERELHF